MALLGLLTGSVGSSKYFKTPNEAWDNLVEFMKTFNGFQYYGKRIKRGLYKASDGRLINADVNSALNILKKVIGKFEYDSIKVCSTPLVVTP